jgi:hypothetical protein
VTNLPNPSGWRTKVMQAVGLLLVVALGARVAASLLAPLVMPLVALAIVGAVLWVVIGRRR